MKLYCLHAKIPTMKPENADFILITEITDEIVRFAVDSTSSVDANKIGFNLK